ncbi:MAG TPA: RNA polymerase sigma factor [Candidatus Atribacteria bacterium]|nr:RNA polymerase sigma factor [Candidatus Atribacteria bacterium]
MKGKVRVTFKAHDSKISKICDRAILEYCKGNRDALADIYDCMARLIFSVAFAITRSYEDAEDVLQQTMIDIARYAHRYERGTNAKAWILAITRHLAIDTVRKRKPQTELTEMPAPRTDFSRLEVLDMLSVLEEDEKELVLYRLYAKMPYGEIADMMKISIPAAQKRYQRALSKLRKYRDSYI